MFEMTEVNRICLEEKARENDDSREAFLLVKT